MTSVKSFLRSSTLWAILAAILPFIGNMIGYDFTAIIDNRSIDFGAIFTVISLIAAAYNRIRATKVLVTPAAAKAANP